MNLGIRWEPSLPQHDVAGRGNHFSIDAFLAGKNTSLYNNAPPGLLFYRDPGIPRAYAGSTYLDFSPRFGLAWDPTGSGKMSIRASYSIFFDTPESFTARDWANAAPWGNQINLNAPVGGFENPFAAYPGGNPFPFPYPPNKDAPFPQQAAYINFPLDLHHPYTQKWNLTVQRQLGKDWLVSATYIGDKGTHYRSSTEANPAQFVPGATLANTNQRRVQFASRAGLLQLGRESDTALQGSGKPEVRIALRILQCAQPHEFQRSGKQAGFVNLRSHPVRVRPAFCSLPPSTRSENKAPRENSTRPGEWKLFT